MEVAIGVTFVYVLVSVVCTAMREGIEAWLKTRAAYLEYGIREILHDKAGTGLGAGLTSLLIFSAAVTSAAAHWAEMLKVFSLGILVGGAAALIGALLGFLFGLPRGQPGESVSNAVPTSPTPQAPGQDKVAGGEISPAPNTAQRTGYVTVTTIWTVNTHAKCP